MSSSSPAAFRRPPLHACTGLRFLAAMGVVGYHFYCPPCTPGAPSFLGNLLQAGFTTVSLFFVLSGFILAYNYLDDRGGFVGTLRGFYQARFARIYPIYLLALVVDVPFFVRSIHLADPAATAGEVARITTATLTLTQAWLQLGRPTWNIMAWTLSAEAFFYLLFPVVAPWLARRGSRQLLALAVTAWFLGVAPHLATEAVSWLGPEGSTSALGNGLRALGQLPVQLIPVARLPEFLLGICLGVLFCRRSNPGRVGPRTVGLLGTCAVLVAVIGLLPAKPSPVMQMAVLVPLFALSIWLLAGGVAWQGLLLGTRPLAKLGEASYALYLTHGTVMGYALALNTRTLSLPHNGVALLMVPVVVAASLVLFKYVEEPGREWLKRLGRPRPALPPEASVSRP
ncbi:acyltransferase [Pyxidicoccus fallax]|uniref:Acyltransferase n=1 Tax=Pyxidicoccus fallax TaxID=394095 RepID=A0A848M1S4_9BACT|nr:acyltransferase [Pyxidicoccus fallax]NMO23433.1 acyltransferase [Pyxidicoccus fallax]NPC86562.1 acyltransferase [Pyxidicoccus fallax]